MNPCMGTGSFGECCPGSLLCPGVRINPWFASGMLAGMAMGQGCPMHLARGNPLCPQKTNSNHTYVHHSVWWQLLSSGMCLPHLFCTDSR